MANVSKIGNLKIASMTQAQYERLPMAIGSNAFVFAPATLEKNQKLNKVINENSVSALNNYAEKENLRIYLTPLENDLFDDLKVSVYSASLDGNKTSFALKLEEGKEGIYNFFKTIYKNVENFANKK